jgi:hypothetical protein
VDKVPDDLIVKRLVVTGAKLIHAHVGLNLSGVVMEISEGGLAHHALIHESASDLNSGAFRIIRFDFLCSVRSDELSSRKWLYASFAEFFEGLTANNFFCG